MTSGVYLIRHVASGRCYVGSSGTIEKRWIRHRCALKHNRHHSEKLQHAWNKYGEAAFEFQVIQECPVPELRPIEQHWMDTLQSPTTGFNCTRKALEHSDEVRERIASRKRGLKASPETRTRMSVAHKGLPIPEKTLQAIHSPSARAKAGEAKRGRPLDARRAAILASPESQAKAAAARKGLPRGAYVPVGPDDPRRRPLPTVQREALKTRVISEETRRRMSESAQRRCAKKEQSCGK